MDNEKDIVVQKDKLGEGKYRAHSLVFQGNKKTFTLYHKAEKIVAAIYVVTGFFPVHEPLAASLRRTGLSVLSLITPLSHTAGESDALRRRVRAKILELISCLDIAHAAGLISPMNAGILRLELVKVVEHIEEAAEESVSQAPGLNEELFVVDGVGAGEASQGQEILSRVWDKEFTQNNKGQYKGHGDIKDRTQGKGQVRGHGVSLKNNNVVPSGSRTPNTSGRTEVILGMLKEKDKVNVKDVASVIKDCSEKTLQRELLAMVAKGVLKKEGERRWSTYALA